jgi:hypothetical protein
MAIGVKERTISGFHFHSWHKLQENVRPCGMLTPQDWLTLGMNGCSHIEAANVMSATWTRLVYWQACNF